ncbi:hypothetical protein [Sessilibacter sp. MAH2]
MKPKLAFCLISIIFSSFTLVAEVFQMIDENSSPLHSKNALQAVIKELKEDGKDLDTLYATANCYEKSCYIEVSLLESF